MTTLTSLLAPGFRAVASVLTLAVSAGVVLAAPASAQLSPGISGSSSAPISGNEDDYWYLMRQMGDCLADHKTEQAMAWLAAEPGSAEETAAVGGLFNRSYNSCMQNFVRASFVRAHLRGTVAESLFRSRRRQLGEEFQPALVEPETITGIHEFARCYVATHFDDAATLLSKSRLSTNEEHELVAAMAPQFGPCLPEGIEIVIRPIEIRLAIAEAMYRTTLPAEEQI